MNSQISFKNHKTAPLIRPGVSAESLTANGIRRVSACEAKPLCGFDEQGGIWIPYRALDGTPIRDNDREFGRLRLAVVKTDGQKYTCATGSHPHLYQPAALWDMLAQPGCTTLHLCEGELKSVSACEHGIVAAGAAGITCAAPGGKLVAELQAILREWPITKIVFVGDSDVSINADFSRAMTGLAKALPDDVELEIIAPGLHAVGKGVDDQAEVLGDGFQAYWETLQAGAIAVPRGTAWESLAVNLLRRESPAAIRAIANGGELVAA